MEILRFITAGNVDDGKSTLIGRLLFDSKAILDDHYADLERSSFSRGLDQVDLSLITDGLRAERDQGITIDVAYRFFTTDKRRFVIIDCPGHVQYTRNMVTGASNASVAVILVDATKGIQEQTRRHAFLSGLLGLDHVMVCVNKMDTVGYSAEVYNKICQEFLAFSPKLEIKDIQFIPISALKGDNVVEPSPNMPWHYGAPLLRWLEEVYVGGYYNLIDFRFPIQGTIRPKVGEKRGRLYTGLISSGGIRKGDKVTVLPSGFESKVKSIYSLNRDLEEAFAPLSVALELEDELDISRGNMIVRSGNLPVVTSEIDARICWLDTQPLAPGRRYILKHTTNEVQCELKELKYKVDVNTHHRLDCHELQINDIGRATFSLGQKIFCDVFRANRFTGSGVIIDPVTNRTAGAVMLRS